MADDETSVTFQTLAHAIADNPSLTHSGKLVLDFAIQLMNADSAFCIAFSKPPVYETSQIEEQQLPVDHLMANQPKMTDIEVSSKLPHPLAEHYAGWLLIPTIISSGEPLLLGLLYRDNHELEDDTTKSLDELLVYLRIVMQMAVTEAKHEKYNANQQEFIRVVSHDLRSPLTSMKGFASILEANAFGKLNDQQANAVDKILSGIDQLATQIDNMQDAGRFDPETGFYEMERSPSDILQLVDNIVAKYLLPAEKQELTLSVDAEADLPIFSFDPLMIERGIINLIDNAIKFTPNGGNITVKLNKVGEKLVIGVKDTGYGISEENLDKLFNRHFRVRRREHKRLKGSGLGLFIVRSVALRHGGKAWVESIENEGSTFFISLPLSPELEPEEPTQTG